MYYTDSVAKQLGNKHELIFLHFDSVVHKYLPQDRSRKAKDTYEKRAKNNKYYDKIIDYKRFNRSVYESIKSIEPDVAVFISIHGFQMRWANYICNKQNINTLHFMHGVKTDKVDKNEDEKLGKLISKIPRVQYYSKMYMQYLGDLLFNKNIKSPALNKVIYDFYELILKHNKYDYNPKYKHTVNYDTICMISETDRIFFNKRYNLDCSKKVIVGHTDMDEILDKKNEKVDIEDKVLYISQPLTDDGISLKKIVRNIVRLSDAVHSHGYKFVVRPHPRDDEEIIAELRSRDISISQNTLAEDILTSSIVAGVDSTLLLSAIKLKIPIVSIFMEGLKKPKFLEEYDMHRRIEKNNSAVNVVKEAINLYERTERVCRSCLEKPSKIIANEVNMLVK